MNEEYIDPRLRRDDVQEQLLIRLAKAAGGRSRSEAKVASSRINAAKAAAARKGKRYPKKITVTPPEGRPSKIKKASDWD